MLQGLEVDKKDPTKQAEEKTNKVDEIVENVSNLQVTSNISTMNHESTTITAESTTITAESTTITAESTPAGEEAESTPAGEEKKVMMEPQTLELENPEVSAKKRIFHRFVIRMRGLAWNTTVEDIRKFFDERQILTIHVVPGSHGRTSGEAMVEFGSEPDLEISLKKDTCLLNKRAVELSIGSPRELDRSLGRRPLPKVPSNPMSFVIRMRGVPYTATVEDIEDFFGELHPLAIHIPKDEFGRPSGDAFVEFEEHDDGFAATYKHRETLGNRYIEIFQSTIKELCQAMGVATKSKYAKRWVKMQGLPYNTQLRQILAFFAAVKVFPIRLARRSDGSQVYAEFSCATDVNNVMKLQQRYIGHRYVELFPCDTNEVEQVTGKKFAPTSLAFKKPSIQLNQKVFGNAPQPHPPHMMPPNARGHGPPHMPPNARGHGPPQMPYDLQNMGDFGGPPGGRRPDLMQHQQHMGGRGGFRGPVHGLGMF